MTTKLAIAISLVVGFVGASLPSNTFRPIPLWPYDKLTLKSDVVVIATLESSKETNEPVTEKELKGLEDDVISVVTTLNVKAVLKGNVEAKTIDLYHYKLREGRLIGNGPGFVKFNGGEVRIGGGTWGMVLEKADYMLFLKARADGRYDCISGQLDPNLAVRQLTPPLPFSG